MSNHHHHQPLLHHQWSNSTNETTFSLQDELLMSGDFQILNKSRRSSDCKSTQTFNENSSNKRDLITDLEDDDLDIIERDMYQEGELGSPQKRVKRMESTSSTSSSPICHQRAEDFHETKIEEKEESSTTKSGSNSNYKEIFKEIFMVLARANNNCT